jgi:ubiquitin-like-specific protease 1C/D
VNRDDPEAVELKGSDINCLEPGAFLSSPVINYYIQ